MSHDFLVGMGVGMAIAFILVQLIAAVFETLAILHSQNPFAYATVEDFQRKTEGG